MSAVIDFHAHVLPAADHGSDGIDTTKLQLSLLKDAGVDRVVATPHFYPDRHTCEYFEEKIDRALNMLSGIECDRPEICLGAEVLYCDGIDRMDGLDRLCIKGTNVLLLELPTNTWERSLFDTVRRLLKKYTVVLAHIDRYAHKQSDDIDELLEMGALAQINVSALHSFFAKRDIAHYIANGSIVAIGSDLHGADKHACKHFAGAQKKLGDEYAEIMARTEKLLSGAQVI